MIALAWALVPAFGEEVVLRTITLVDGRRFDAQVLATKATGLELRVVQGTLLLPFEQLVDISPVPGAAPAAEPWRVLVAFPSDVEPAVDAVLQAVPKLAPSRIGGSDDLAPAMAERLTACGAEVACLCRELRGEPWRWVVVGEHTAGVGLRVRSLVSTSGDQMPHEVHVAVADVAHLWPALHEALGLHTPPLPDEFAGGRSRSPRGSPSEGRISALSLVPLPGAPALFGTHDGGAAAVAFAVVLPSAAAWTGLSALATSDERDFLVLAGAGYLGLTVMTNQWVGERSRRKLTASALPTAEGAVATLGGTF